MDIPGLTNSRDSLGRNITTNLVNYGFTLAMAFVMLPVMIRYLGADRYGVWILATEFIGYLAFLDIGIRTAVVYYAAVTLARRDTDDLNRAAATALWSLVGLGGVLIAASWEIARIFPRLFKISGAAPAEVSWMVVLTTLMVAATLPSEVLTAILNGGRRLDLVNVIDTSTRFAGLIATVICLLAGRGLVALTAVQVGVKLSSIVVTRLTLGKIIPELSLHPRHWRMEWLVRLCRYGAPSLLINLGQAVSGRIDLIIVGMFLGVRMVTLYSIPRNLMQYALTGTSAITLSYTAHLTHLAAGNKTKELLRLYEDGSRLSGVAIWLLVGYIVAFGPSFLAIWQGPAFVTGPWTGRADIALLILAAAFLPRMTSNLGSQLLLATGRLSFPAWCNTLEAVVKIALSPFLVLRWGLAGMAMANLIPMLLGEGVAIPLYLLRVFPIHLREFGRNVLARPLAAGGTGFVCSVLLVMWRRPHHWPVFLVEASVAALCGLLVAVRVGLDPAERNAAGGILLRIKSQIRLPKRTL